MPNKMIKVFLNSWTRAYFKQQVRITTDKQNVMVKEEPPYNKIILQNLR